MAEPTTLPLTAAHWGVYRAEASDGQLRALHPFERDPDPSPIAQGYLGVLDDDLRIRQPMIRKSWLDSGPGTATDRRGTDPFVPVDWETVTQLVAEELNRVLCTHGNQAIFGGSYGWSSAGRFHHAQSQLHRFLNCIGGYTRSVNTYSLAAGEVILSRVLGNAGDFIHSPPSWQSVVDSCELVVAFGGMPLRNSQISAGGTGRHRAREALRDAKKAGVSFVNISPICSDISGELDAEWLPARPGSDVAIMLGIAHEVLRNGWHDIEFLHRYTTGFEEFAEYLTGKSDGVAKTADWAADIADIPAESMRRLAHRMSRVRTIISASWSLTRQQHGEQPFWMATTLAAMLGQIGLPGAGVAFGYCAANSVGNEKCPVSYAALPQLENPVTDFIPVARISDMLLSPGENFRFDGQTFSYPDVRLVYWAGGNPFHHHQDLTRLSAAWEKPETVIVNEWCWNALAKRADIVLPCTTPLERTDIMLTPRDRFVVRMEAAVPPVGEARDDHDIFRAISSKMGVESRFTDGRSKDEWLEWIYTESRDRARKTGVELPEYRAFCDAGWHETDLPTEHRDAFSAFRNDPVAAPLNTPSGRIEITSSAIAAFGGASILPYPAWYEPDEWLGRTTGDCRFHLISGQPPDKLHSQLDHGTVSKTNKVDGRSPVRIHPSDAKCLGISTGDTVRLHNERGACLGTAVLDCGLLRGIVQMSTGAWLDAECQDDGTLLCRHGNPNMLTRDVGTSEIAQGPTAHTCLVAVSRYSGRAPVQAFNPPDILTGLK